MKNFDWTSFTKRIAVKATLIDLYLAWTTKAGLESWFLQEVRINRDDTRLNNHTPALANGSL